MKKEPILLIMAAGMGSRYGGLKQMDPVGPNGEVILDYSIYDAKRAGFKRVIFLIKHAIEEDFKKMIGDHISKEMEVQYAYQEVDKIPAPFTVPEGRIKPWGTGHAVLCCSEFIDAPFAVINADDYYGVSAYEAAYQALTAIDDEDSTDFMMVGFPLKNTLTDNGHVARGVCTMNENGLLQDICERTHIISTTDGPLFTEDGETYRKLDENGLVSMNMWGFSPALLQALKSGFVPFLQDTVPGNPMKAEYFLPSVVDDMLKQGNATVKVLPSRDKWYGVTYQADKPVICDALADMAQNGLYPTPLWNK